MSQIIHIQTQIQTTLGQLDDQGNVVTTQPINLTINKLELEAFQAAFEHVLKVKNQANAKESDE